MSQPAQRPATAAARRTVVLLHATVSSARQWDALADALRATHDVHAIDLHGHGRRAPWSGPRAFSLHDDAALAVDVLERAGGGHVVGHSYGGAVALHLAAARPELVRSLAVYEPVMLQMLAHHATDPGTVEVVDVVARVRRHAAEGDADGAAARFVDYWSGAGAYARMDPRTRAAIAARMDVVLAHFDTLFADPLPATAPQRLTMPLLVLHGDRTTRAAHLVAARLAQLLPRAEHASLPGLGHMAPVTHAARVNPTLLDFLHRAARREDRRERNAAKAAAQRSTNEDPPRRAA